MRRYWMPALLSSELPHSDSEPIRVRLLDEDLVGFRDTNGKVGVIQNNCPHRGASLFFGRNEEAGIRCVYHGWKFDLTGQCIDTPNEPAESDFKSKVRATAYPREEKAGIVWTYMGPPEKQPPQPDYEWMRAPDGWMHASKTFENCNFLQSMEGGLDTSHSSFLHRNLDQEGLRNPRAGGPADSIGNTDGHMWVPIDDVTTWTWNFHFNHTGPQSRQEFDRFEHQMGRGPQAYVPGTFKLKANWSNDFNLSRERQRTVNYTGIEGTNTQDFAIQESMGPIYDRTQERLRDDAPWAESQLRTALVAVY